MKNLTETQTLLTENLQPNFFEGYLSERERLINKLMTVRYGKKIPYSDKDKKPYLESGPLLIQYMREYSVIALEVNPIIFRYNKIAEKTLSDHPTDLTELNEIAGELCMAYRNTNIRDLRKRVGVLKTKKRLWMKMDVPYRTSLFKGLDGAAQMLDEAIKMKKRTKRLDAKVSYPYWLW